MKQTVKILAVALCIAACQKEATVPSLSLETTSQEGGFEVGHMYTELNIPVTSNVPSKAEIVYEGEESGWITLLPSVLKGNGIYTLWIKDYGNVLRDRKAKLIVTAGDLVQEYPVNQLAKPGLSITPKSLATTKSSGDFTVEVGSRYGWSITVENDAKSWCNVETPTGEGPTAVKLTLSEIPNDGMAIGHVTVKSDDGQFTETLTIQHGFARQIGNVIWAKSNVDEPGFFAATADNRGKLYQYSSKVAWPNAGGKEDLTTPAGYPAGETDNGIPDWTAESDPCPEGWTVPTTDQVEALTGLNRDTHQWWTSPAVADDIRFLWKEADATGFAVPGAICGISRAKLTDAVKGDLKGGIFVPQAGYRDRDSGKHEHWWEASFTTRTRPGQNWDRHVLMIDWLQGAQIWWYAGNYSAFPVRCVAK